MPSIPAGLHRAFWPMTAWKPDAAERAPATAGSAGACPTTPRPVGRGASPSLCILWLEEEPYDVRCPEIRGGMLLELPPPELSSLQLDLGVPSGRCADRRFATPED